MSRSRRKTKIFGNARSTSEKDDKRHCNRLVRRAARAIAHDPDAVHVCKSEAMDVWSMSKDGRRYWCDATEKDMRK